MSKEKDLKATSLPNKTAKKHLISQITKDEAELLRGYLIEVILKNYSLCEKGLEEITKLSNHQLYQEIDLGNKIYDTLLNYCVLALDATNEKNVMLFNRLLNKVADNVLEYGHGDREYNGWNLSTMSDLKPLEVAVYADTDSANKFAYILAKRGYGTKWYEEGATAAHLAAITGNYKLVKMLATLPDVDFNKEDIDGLPPLYDAIMGISIVDFHKYKKVVIKLIELGANVNHPLPKDEFYTPIGNTLLHMIVDQGSLEMLKVAKNYGADFSIVDDIGNSLVHHAIFYNKSKILEFLLDQGYGVNDCNIIRGYTTLDLLAKKGMYEFIELAIDKGADIAYKNQYGISPLDYATVFFLSRWETEYDRGVKTINILFKKGYVFTETDNEAIANLKKLGEKKIIDIIVEANNKYSSLDTNVERTSSSDESIIYSDELLEDNYSVSDDESIYSSELLEGNYSVSDDESIYSSELTDNYLESDNDIQDSITTHPPGINGEVEASGVDSSGIDLALNAEPFNI